RADYLTGFTRRHPEARRIELVRNYRSTPEVVATANTVMRNRQAVSLTAQRPSGAAVAQVDAADEAAEARSIAQWLADRHDDGVDWREMAVLFRVNSQSPAYEAALSDRGIPYLVRGAERFYDRPEVRQALLVVRAEARMDPEAAAAERVRALLGGIGWAADPPAGAGTTSLAPISAELERRAEVQHVPTADGVTLTTLHSSKGLEWDAVAVVGVQEGTLPFVLATGDGQLAEERRLLYVGITRARSHLQLSWSRSRSGGTMRNPSRFLDGLRPPSGGVRDRDGGTRGGVAARSPRVRRTVQPQHCRSCGQVLRTGADHKLGRHTDCPATYDEDLLQ